MGVPTEIQAVARWNFSIASQFIEGFRSVESLEMNMILNDELWWTSTCTWVSNWTSHQFVVWYAADRLVVDESYDVLWWNVNALWWKIIWFFELRRRVAWYMFKGHQKKPEKKHLIISQKCLGECPHFTLFKKTHRRDDSKFKYLLESNYIKGVVRGI